MEYGRNKKRSFFGPYLLVSLLTLLVSCDDDDGPVSESTYLWTPAISAEKGDGEATIHLGDPTALALYAYPGPATPSHFTIMMSDDLEDFSPYKTVNEIGSVRIDNLVNDKPYYFYVTAHRKHFPSVETDTLMMIPSVAFERTDYTPFPATVFERFSASFDELFRLYRVNDKYYQFSLNDPDVVHLIDNQSYYARWSPISNQLVYLKNTLVGAVSYPSSINIYHPETRSATTLLTIPYDNYIAGHPCFTPDESKITFLSTEGNSKAHSYDLWSIDLTTEEKLQLSEFEGAGFYTNSPFVWDKTGEEVYLAGAYNLIDTDIYKFNLTSKALTPVVASKWSEKDPMLSPDENSIAFVSGRSGKDEVWIYNLASSKFRQITGEGDYRFPSTYAEVQWLDNERLLVTVIEGTQHVASTLKVN